MAFLLGVARHAGSPPSRNTLPRFRLASSGVRCSTRLTDHARGSLHPFGGV